MKNRREIITEFVQSASQDELIDTIQSLSYALGVGISGLQGENWLSSRKVTKKDAIKSALEYCLIASNSAWNKITRKDTTS